MRVAILTTLLVLLALALNVGVGVGEAQSCGCASFSCEEVEHLIPDAVHGCADFLHIYRRQIQVLGIFSTSQCVYCTAGCSYCLNATVGLWIVKCDYTEELISPTLCCRDPECCG